MNNNKSNHAKIFKIHEKKMIQIINKEKNIKELELEKKDLVLKLNRADNKDFKNIYNINCSINKIQRQIEYISSGSEELDYMFNSVMYVQKYSEERDKLKMDLSQTEIYEIENNMENIFREYMISIDPEYKYVQPNTCESRIELFCSNCDNSNYIFKDSSGFYVCESCGYEFRDVINISSTLSYKQTQELDFKIEYTYVKQSHLSELLKRFQAKERKQIPEEVISGVISEARKERISDLNELTDKKVRTYLKKLKYNIYYDNVVSIINIINNRPPLKLTIEVEEKIKRMFQQIQKPFEKYKDKNRKNMLSYTYLLRKFFEILGMKEYALYFPLLKTQEKLRQQDEVFKKIVEEVAEEDKITGWIFYPSI